MKLKGKVALVTGASSGMGRAIAHLFAKEGAQVYGAARRIERLEELAEETKDFEGRIIPYQIDLMDRQATLDMVDFVKKDAGKLDILVNNAGIMDDFSPVGDVSDQMLRRVFELNVFTLFNTTGKAVKIFEEQGGGVIVNIASLSGLYGARAGAVYTAAKHAVVGLTKNTAFMYADRNIRINAIGPGGVDTEIAQSEFMKNINMEGMNRITPMMAGNPRTGSPQEIAHIALFLASDDSSFVNGQVLIADAGWTAY